MWHQLIQSTIDSRCLLKWLSLASLVSVMDWKKVKIMWWQIFMIVWWENLLCQFLLFASLLGVMLSCEIQFKICYRKEFEQFKINRMDFSLTWWLSSHDHLFCSAFISPKKGHFSRHLESILIEAWLSLENGNLEDFFLFLSVFNYYIIIN